MGIFIKDKTICRICGQVIASSAGMVGFPNTGLPTGLEELGDSCLHRSCLDTHVRRDDLLQMWRQHWLEQAKNTSTSAAITRHSVVIFNKKRFVFAALDTFVELEDQLEEFSKLQKFFVSFDGCDSLSAVTTWNTYKLTAGAVGTRLLVTLNSAPSITLRVVQESTVLDYDFMAKQWEGFVAGWAQLASR